MMHIKAALAGIGVAAVLVAALILLVSELRGDFKDVLEGVEL